MFSDGTFSDGTFLEWDVTRAGPFVCTPRKKLADLTSANPLILDSILTNLHLKYSNSYILVYYKYMFFLFFKIALAD
jgi:hypothetical protein